MPSITEIYEPTDQGFLHAINRARHDGHRYLMSCLNDPTLDKDSPRSSAGLLWKVSPELGTLTVRRRAHVPFEPTAGKIRLKESLDPQPSLPEHLNFQEPLVISGDIARLYSPLIKVDPEVEEFFKAQGLAVPKRPRSRLMPVQQQDLRPWLTAKLERLGLTVHMLVATVALDIRMTQVRRSESVPVANFEAQVTGSRESIEKLVDAGLGRSKNYGLGLISVSQ